MTYRSLWLLADPAALGDHHCNIQRDKKFLEYNLYLKRGRWLEGAKLKAAATALKNGARRVYFACSLQPEDWGGTFNRERGSFSG